MAIEKYPSKQVLATAEKMAADAARAARGVQKSAGWLAIIAGVADFIYSGLPNYTREVLARLGIVYGVDENITMQTLTEKVSALSGIPLTNLADPQQTKNDLQAWAFESLNNELGLNIGSNDTSEGIQGAIKDAVIDALAGGGNKLLNARLVAQCADAVRDMNSRGESFSDGFNRPSRARRYRNRIRQREWESTHEKVFS